MVGEHAEQSKRYISRIDMSVDYFIFFFFSLKSWLGGFVGDLEKEMLLIKFHEMNINPCHV